MGQKREQRDVLCIEAIQKIEEKVKSAEQPITSKLMESVATELRTNPDIRHACLNSVEQEKYLSSTMLEA